MQSYANQDSISNLPVDKNPPLQHEQQIVDALFTKHKSTMDSVFQEGKDSFLVGILFVLFSLPQIDQIIYKVIPSAQNSLYITIAFKALAMMALYWLIKHFYLSRK